MSISLHTKYLNLDLKNPIVASSGPLTGRIDTLMKLEEAGAAAVVLPSLFEEQISREEVEIALLYDFSNEGFAEAQSYLPAGISPIEPSP
ncbi:MAG: dihydroorotate dehydrogenase-like protein, partial [Isosphaeraceae bacterium]